MPENLHAFKYLIFTSQATDTLIISITHLGNMKTKIG